MAYSGATYVELRTMVGAVVRRRLSADDDTAILLAGLAVNAGLRSVQEAWRWRVLEGTVTTDDEGDPLVTTAGVRTVALPARYRDSLRVYWATAEGSPLQPLTNSVRGKPIGMEWVRANHPDASEESETPLACCIHGEQLVIVPTPASALSLTLDGRWYVADLAADGDRNWFTMHAPMPLVQFGAGHCLQMLHEEEWARSYLELGATMLRSAIEADVAESVLRTGEVVGQEPL